LAFLSTLWQFSEESHMEVLCKEGEREVGACSLWGAEVSQPAKAGRLALTKPLDTLVKLEPGPQLCRLRELILQLRHLDLYLGHLTLIRLSDYGITQNVICPNVASLRHIPLHSHTQYPRRIGSRTPCRYQNSRMLILYVFMM
jgi:hypothetical protein